MSTSVIYRVAGPVVAKLFDPLRRDRLMQASDGVMWWTSSPGITTEPGLAPLEFEVTRTLWTAYTQLAQLLYALT